MSKGVKEDNLLLIKVKDDYNFLPKKVIRAFQAIKETFQFKYILKTDDKQKVTNIKFFDTVILLLNRKYDDFETRICYGGYIVNVQNP